MATSLPAAGGGVKGKRSVCCGRRARKVLRHRRERRAPQTVHNRQPVCRLPPYNPNGRHKNIPARLSRDIEICKEILLAGLFNSNGHGNGHTDHGVVTCAQEAHHFHIKPHLRWCLHWDTTTFSAGNPIFHKTRSTSFESMMMCFPSLGTSYHIMCSRNKCFNLNYTPRTSFIIFSHLLRSTKSNEAFPILSASKNKLKKDFLFADLSNNIG